ncbi:MAG: cation:proton antiporter, partial [Chloroflexota bacterium]|nr:cation:proton antiporter [Chloroflexota bacterium]
MRPGSLPPSALDLESTARERLIMSLATWLLLLSALLAGAVLLGVLARRTRLPLTVVLATVGFIAGWLGTTTADLQSPLHGEAFEEVLVFVFLPVLVFEAAIGLSTRAFVRNLGPILVLAIPALAISAAVVGLALRFGLGTPLIPALLFGALISATDPVAVVAVFRELGVPRRLLTLVEGESLLNDGVAIVLFTILLAAALGGELSA